MIVIEGELFPVMNPWRFRGNNVQEMLRLEGQDYKGGSTVTAFLTPPLPFPLPPNLLVILPCYVKGF